MIYKALAGIFLVLSILLGVAWAVERSALTQERLAFSKAKEAYAVSVAAAEKKSLEASEEYRAKEQQWMAQAKVKDDERSKEKTSNARVIAGLRADVGMRDKLIADYAVGSGQAADAAAASCRERAAALGRGLAATLHSEEELVGELEDSRSDTRRLLDDAKAARGLK